MAESKKSEPKSTEYVVLEGKHRENKVVYKKGDIVKSERDLPKMFKNKFVPAADARAQQAKAEVEEEKKKAKNGKDEK
jgi:hypothetical protein